MNITAIETIRCEEFPNLLWVQLRTSDGTVGLGETFMGAAAAEAHIHDVIAPALLGKSPHKVGFFQDKMLGYLGFNGASAEMRGRSAVDIALWDLWGQQTNQSVAQLLGGPIRDELPVYNTCAGSGYVRQSSKQQTQNFGLGHGQVYEDLQAFMNTPDELAYSLLEMGITAMKIWPFDYAAELSGGYAITPAQMEKALEPFIKIRKALGDKMEIMAELHSLWSVPMALKICHALEQFSPHWVEDPVFQDNLQSMPLVAEQTRCPIAAGERLGGLGEFASVITPQRLSVAILDITWCGGLSVAQKVAALAEAHHTPVAAHDCTGPVALTAAVHFACGTSNVYIQEIVRAFYYGWYADVLDSLPPLHQGRISLPDGVGLGVSLQKDFLDRQDCHIRIANG